MRKPKISRKIAAPLLVFFTGLHTAPAEDAFSEADQDRARELVEQLRADDFAERQQAVAELEALPPAALPWLEEMVEAKDTMNLESHIRLKSIAHTVEKREMERTLRKGTKVKFDLKAAKPGAVLEALKKQIGSSLTSLSARDIWEAETEKDFSFEGPFWEAVDAMLKTYPPKGGGRENLGGDYDFSQWGAPGFGAADNTHATNGILRVRNGRVSLENNGGKDYLVVTLVPSVEPTHQVEELALLVSGLTLGDGTTIAPEETICGWTSENRGTIFIPGNTYTWTFPLEKGTNLRGPAKLAGVAKIRARRFDWEEVELPENLNAPVGMTPDVRLTVLGRDAGQLKIQFEGSGSKPMWASNYTLRKEAHQVLDKDGKLLDFKVRRGTSNGLNGWRTSYEGTIEGEPARVRAMLRSAELEVQLDFGLSDLPLPGSSLAQ